MTDSIWRVARIALALGLVALLVLGVRRSPDPGEPVLVDAATTAHELAEILVRDTAAMLTYADAAAPTRAVAALLASAAEGGAQVTLAVPGDAGRLRVVPPDRPVARRRAALTVSVRAEPGSEVPVTVAGRTGAADTVLVPVGPDGRGSASVAVEPSRPGAASWTVRTPDAEATAHAWVRPDAPVRVLMWSGAPGWESRFLVRALEAAGMDVAVRQDLGRDRAVTTEGARAPRTLDDLAAYDVLALVGAAADAADALARQWVEERGGGLLLVGAGGWPAAGGAPGPLAPWAPLGEATEVAVAEIDWTGPAEIVPLPAAEIVARGVAVPGGGMPVAEVGGERLGAPTVAGSAGGSGSGAAAPRPTSALARAFHVGRGRIYASGLETWPWAMEAGLGADHEAYWESVVEWLAGGLTEDVLLGSEPAQPWVRWRGRIEGDVPTALMLRRPGGVPGEASADEPLPAIGGPLGSPATLSFVPVAEGAHVLEPARPRAGDAAATASPATDSPSTAPPTFGTVAVPPGERLTWPAAGLEIGRAGGRVVLAGEPALAASGQRARPSRALPWIAFLLLAALAASAWTARRVGGRP